MKKLLLLLLLLLPVNAFGGFSHVVQVDPLNSIQERMATFDNYFSVPVGISVAHHECHQGNCYEMTFNDESMNIGELIELSLRTPDTDDPQKRIHMVIQSGCLAGEGSFMAEEDVTTLAQGSGSVIIPSNKGRGSAETTATTLTFSGSTGGLITSTGGTIIPGWDRHFGSGNNLGGVERDSEEWILKPSSNYVFTVTSEGNGNECVMRLFWYEHTDE